jgi:hypothetical protein
LSGASGAADELVDDEVNGMVDAAVLLLELVQMVVDEV